MSRIKTTAWQVAAATTGVCALLGAAVAASDKPSQLRDGADAPPRNDAASGWVSEASSKDLAIYSRLRDGTALKEFKGVGVIEAAPGTVFAVLDDSEAYQSFMPYTAECRILRRDKDVVLAYQRLQLPLVSDRDYTLRSRNAKWLGPAGAIYRIRWEPANDQGPAEKAGVLRVNVCEGGWLLEPDAEGTTRATYSIFTDSGGALPTFVANNGSRIAIRKVFEAIRKQAKQPKYTAMRD